MPAASLYVPAPHDTHAPPLGPVYPALHKHAWIPTLPKGEEELLGQLSQSALTRYLPASQGFRAMRAAPTKFSDALKPFCLSCMLTRSKVSAAKIAWASRRLVAAGHPHR